MRGPIVISGYSRNPTADAESFDGEGFFKTGDIAYCASVSSKWYIVDRKKGLIKVRGFQVAPPELETVLLSHSMIIDAAVIGVKDRYEADVEHPRAYVVRRQAGVLDEEEVKRWCGERLARFKELSGGVRFVESIPKNVRVPISLLLLFVIEEPKATRHVFAHSALWILMKELC